MVPWCRAVVGAKQAEAGAVFIRTRPDTTGPRARQTRSAPVWSTMSPHKARRRVQHREDDDSGEDREKCASER